MADAAMIMTENGGEVMLAGFDLARDDGLATAVIISLFTDRRATSEQIPAEMPQDDLRGGGVGDGDHSGERGHAVG